MTTRIPIAVSARHVHLTQATIDCLFGAGYVLRPQKWLTQPGEFAAWEMVRLVGPRGILERVRIVGPPRRYDQVEVAGSDSYVLGVDAPVRLSGYLADTPGIVIEGPAGGVTLRRGVIVAKRHIHMSPEDAQRLGVHDGQAVTASAHGDSRSLVFGDIIVRIAAGNRLELHIDTDEANAAGVRSGDAAELHVGAALSRTA